MHKYWVVHNFRHGYPTTKYETSEEAIAEARRLAAENPRDEFIVTEAILLYSAESPRINVLCLHRKENETP